MRPANVNVRVRVAAVALALGAASSVKVRALDNGLSMLPPMGWRNWWSMFGDVDQPKMEAAFRVR